MQNLAAEPRPHDRGEPLANPRGLAPERQLTLFRVGSLLTDSGRDLCLVKRVYSGGALIRVYGEVRPGEPVCLELKGQAAIEGTVDTVIGTDAMIQFNKPIDVLALLKMGAAGPRPRMPRIDVRAFALIRQGAIVHRASVDNISQGGVSALCGAELMVGEHATVMLTAMPPVAGVIRWSNSGRCGITFNALIGLPVLVQWLHAQTAVEDAID
jgi:hypothetical protein